MNQDTIAALLPSVLDGQPWLERFSRYAYPNAFQDYQETYAPAWSQALQEAGETGLADLAGAFLDALTANWARRRFWQRNGAKLDTQQMIVYYLSPMLLECGEKQLAELLRDAWAARWPKEAYRLASREKLQKGFRLSILGIPLPERHDGGDGEI